MMSQISVRSPHLTHAQTHLVLAGQNGSFTKTMKGKSFHPPVGWRAMGPMVKPPKVIVKSVENGKETCERHVNQMLMRGEQIAFISVTGT
ncbi:hypothetical protein RUM44_012758 [Polyplax serrata]|uniref:Uncharacterized protein n=1 Tax=Polyplax serrata TaxID=468196 RepID=A0ABR1BE47_POLSC